MRLAAPRISALLLCVCLSAGCATGRHGDGDLPNFQKVSHTLYRGGQPTRDGVERLHAMGVKTIVNVRRSDTDRPLLNDLEFDYHRRGMSPWSPSDEHVLWFLALATDAQRNPIYLHCHHGSDRTGYLVAMYRVVVEGWDRQRAIAEMTAHGNGFHDIFQGLVNYIESADVEHLRRQLAIRTPRGPNRLAQLPEQPPAWQVQADSSIANRSNSE